MPLFDKLFHHDQPHPDRRTAAPPAPLTPQDTDAQAIARYRYLLQTAPPEDIERAHEEAFARLTPAQRQIVLQQLTAATPADEAAQLSAEPHALAVAATRGEIRAPGFLEKSLSTPGLSWGGATGSYAGTVYEAPAPGYAAPGFGLGGSLAGSVLGSIAGYVITSAIANAFFSNRVNEELFLQSPYAFGVPGGISYYDPGLFWNAPNQMIDDQTGYADQAYQEGRYDQQAADQQLANSAPFDPNQNVPALQENANWTNSDDQNLGDTLLGNDDNSAVVDNSSDWTSADDNALGDTMFDDSGSDNSSSW